MNPRTSAIGRLVLAGAFALFATACTKNEVAPPTVTVTVTPGSATINVGETVQLAATVSGASDQSVTWSSSSASVATVDANGLVTGVAAGGATITATHGSAAGAAAITVKAGGSTGPADTINSVTIQSITRNGSTATMDPNNLNGTIDVTLNIDATPGAVSAIKLFVDSTQACEQTLNSSSSVAQASDKPAAQQSQQAVVCTFNTGKYDATTGMPAYLNGPHSLVAKVYAKDGSLGANATQAVVFANENMVALTMTTDTSAINPNTGIKWYGGSLTATAIPVMYSGGTISRVTFKLNDLETTVVGNRTDATPTDGFTMIYPADSTPANNGVMDVTDSVYVSVTTVTSTGSNGPTAFAMPIGLDNTPPAHLTFAAHPTLPYDWAKGSTTFSSMVDSTGTVDSGVMGVTYAFQAGPALDSLSDVTTGGDLADSQDSTRYVATMTATDALGNSTTMVLSSVTSATDTTHFGVDTQAPTIDFAPVTTASNRVAADTSFTTDPTAATANSFAVEYQDVGYSGFATVTPVQVTIVRTDTVSTNDDCLEGSTTTTSCDTPANDDGSSPVLNTEGYQTYTAYVQDKAGNKSPVLTRTVLVDQTAPGTDGSSFAGPTTLKGGVAATFTDVGVDNLDFKSSAASIDYGTGSFLFSMGAAQTFGTWGKDVLTTSADLSNSTDMFIRALEDGVGGTWYNVDGISYDLADVAGNNATVLESVTAPTGSGSATWNGVNSWLYTGATTDPTTLEATLTVNTTVTSNSPFAQVRFYELVNGVYQYVGTAASPAISDNTGANTRTFRYSMTAPSMASGSTHTFTAVGIDANGDAVKVGNATITIS